MNPDYSCPEPSFINWKESFIQTLTLNELDFTSLPDALFDLILLKEKPVVLHMIDLHHQITPDACMNLQASFYQQGIKMVHVWADIWINKPALVLARIKSLLGLNTRIHGRKTKIERIDKPTANAFLQQNHLLGSVGSRYKFGLFLQQELVGVATFSALRKMKHTDNYFSAELIRFAVLKGYTITGGLGKLIKHFNTLYHPDDIMTYADRDWSAGDAYLKLGFEQTGQMEAQYFILDKTGSRHPAKDNADKKNSIEVFNTGSLKYLLRF